MTKGSIVEPILMGHLLTVSSLLVYVDITIAISEFSIENVW